MQNTSTARLQTYENKIVELITLPRDNLAAVIAVLDFVCTNVKTEDPELRMLTEALEEFLDVYNRRKSVTAYLRPRRFRS